MKRTLVLALLIAGCIVRQSRPTRITGTCDGACDHYVSCKSGHTEADRTRCRAECPDVFSDADSIVQYELLSCRDAVEYVDGTPRQTARP